MVLRVGSPRKRCATTDWYLARDRERLVVMQDGSPPDQLPGVDTPPLQQISALITSERALLDALDDAVARARQQGVTWEAIAEAAELPYTTAYSRWRALDPPSGRYRDGRRERGGRQQGPGLEL
jgi:hypothetical protein